MPSKWGGKLRGAEVAASRIASQDAAAENNARYDAESARVAERTAVADERYGAETARVAERTAVTDKRYDAETARTTGRDAITDKRYTDERTHQTGREKVMDARYTDDRLWQRAAETRRQDREVVQADQARQSFDQAHEAADMEMQQEKAAAMYNGSTQFIYGASRGFPPDVVIRAYNATLEEGLPKMTGYAKDDDGAIVSMFDDGISRQMTAEQVQSVTAHFDTAGRTTKRGESTRQSSGDEGSTVDVKGVQERIKAIKEDIGFLADPKSESDRGRLARLKGRLSDYENMLDRHFLGMNTDEEGADPATAAPKDFSMYQAPGAPIRK